MTRAIIFGILMWAVGLYAFRRGGWEERIAAAGIIVTTYLSVLVMGPILTRYRHLEVEVALLDSGLFVLLMAITVRSRSFWPMWLAAMQGLTVLAHLVAFMPDLPASIYYNAAVLWSYPMLILLGLAVYRHDAAHRRGATAHR